MKEENLERTRNNCVL